MPHVTMDLGSTAVIHSTQSQDHFQIVPRSMMDSAFSHDYGKLIEQAPPIV